MRIEIIPYDITRHDEPGPFCGTLGEVVRLPTSIVRAPSIGERLIWQRRAYTVDEVTRDYDRGVVIIRARRWPAKVAP